ncbi:MAG: hypothetical protein KGS60_18895 [Verrucomicrobia bacterium]|nr:hypothetical protein [Verrucomicrobiota bacterium]
MPSDAFTPDWTPPTPVLSPADIAVNLAAADSGAGPDLTFTEAQVPTLADLDESHVLAVRLQRFGTADPDEAEREALGKAMRAYRDSGGRATSSGLDALEQFLTAHPNSPYRASLLREIGDGRWMQGSFSRAVSARAEAWTAVSSRRFAAHPAGKSSGLKVNLASTVLATARFTFPWLSLISKGHTRIHFAAAGTSSLGGGDSSIADRDLAGDILAEYLAILGTTGQKELLEATLKSVEGRVWNGNATEAIHRARVTLGFFKNQPEQNIFCGFIAANQICVPLGQAPFYPDIHDDKEKADFIRNGLSLFELRAHSRESGGNLSVFRATAASAPIPVPSVIHLKFNHYSALTEQNEEGLIRVVDPGMKFDSWVAPETLRAEGSGYFVVPGDETPEGFAPVDDATAKTVFGRHCVHGYEDEKPNECPPTKAGGNATKCGMTTYAFDSFQPGIYLEDTPIAYSPPYGPGVSFTLNYDQRALEIDTFKAYGGFGTRWSHPYRSVIKITGTGTNPTVSLIRGDGSFAIYTYNTAAAAYKGRYADMPQLVRLTSTQGGPGYQLTYTDGSKLLFTRANAASNPSAYLLSAQVDPFGNRLTLTYDASLRLIRLTDALNQVTTIAYTGTSPNITKITDPFGRIASFQYSASGRLTRVTDPAGIVSEILYDADDATVDYGNLDFPTRITTPYGVTKFKWGTLPGVNEAPGRWVEATDPAGDTERMEQNDLANFPTNESPLALTSVSVGGVAVPFLPKNDLLYYRNSYQWDKKQYPNRPGETLDHAKATIRNWLARDNNIVPVLGSMKSPLEGRVWFNYPGQTTDHAAGTMSSPAKVVRHVENADGSPGTWTMSQTAYNAKGLPTLVTDETGRQTTIDYATNGTDVVAIRAAAGTLATFGNYVNGRPKTITDASGAVTTLTLNSRGQVLSSTSAKSGSSLATNYTYNTQGFLTQVAVGGKVKAVYTYDGAGRVSTARDAAGYILTYNYDHLDRVTLVSHPDGTREQVVYQAHDATAFKDRQNRWTRIKYNSIRQPQLVLDPKGQITAYDWCRCGSISALTDPRGQTTRWKRDVEGRVTEKILPDGRKHLYSYQAYSGRLAAVAFPKDATAFAAGGAATIRYGYYPDGALAKVDYGDGAIADVTYAYDSLGRLSSMVDGQGTTTYGYNAIATTVNGAGQLATINGPWQHDTIAYTYDPLGRPLSRQVKNDSGVVLQSESLAYLTTGEVDKITNDLGVHTMAYDTSSRLTQIATRLPGQSATSAAFLSTAFTWDTQSRLTALRNRQGATAKLLSDYTYEWSQGGDINKWTAVRGDRSPAYATSVWDLSYDPLGQLTGLTEKNGAGAVTKTWGWAYDGSGNRTHEVEGNGLRLASIGGANRLDQIGGAGAALIEGTVNEPATVSVNGQTAAVRALPGGSQYLFSKELALAAGTHEITVTAQDQGNNTTLKRYNVTVGGTERTLTYDLNGNLTEEAVAGGATRVYQWDSLNRLTAIQSDKIPVAGSWRTEFTYDGQSRRVGIVEKVRDDSGWSTESNARYLWEGAEIVQKRDASGSTVVAKYFDQGEIRVFSSSPEPYYYTRDHLGSVREVVNQSGVIAQSFDYTAWGERTSSTAGSLEWGFTGHHYHEKSGLCLAMYRAYDANLGRWLSEDPIGEAGGVNLYGYVGNAPFDLMDPDGNEPAGTEEALAKRHEQIRSVLDAINQTPELDEEIKVMAKYCPVDYHNRDHPTNRGYYERGRIHLFSNDWKDNNAGLKDGTQMPASDLMETLVHEVCHAAGVPSHAVGQETNAQADQRFDAKVRDTIEKILKHRATAPAKQ